MTAPEAENAQQSCWHGVERAGTTSFRWTRAGEITWQLQSTPLQPCILTVAIPAIMEIQPGFSESCSIALGDSSVIVSREGDLLRASLVVERPIEATLRLITPSPIRPCDLGVNPDERLLGLAIAID